MPWRETSGGAYLVRDGARFNLLALIPLECDYPARYTPLKTNPRIC